MKNLAQKSASIVRRAWKIAVHHPKALFLAGVIIGSFLGHTVSVMITDASYRLSDKSVQLIGGANKNLTDKLKLDKNTGTYRFNADAVTPEMSGETDPSKIAAMLSSRQQQTGGGSKDSKNLYALDLPIDPTQGTKIYDTNSKTSFKLIPEFEMGAGRTESGRVVYPIDEGGQAVYTVKANGIKEDIVLQKPRGDQLSFKYKLELPKTLEARLDDRGNLGIYSVDPSISNAIAGALQNGASSTDTERLKDVQQNGTKNFLTYLIPTPTIIQSGDQPNGHAAKAMYRLNGDQLTVETTGLEKLIYPISIDPTVVVTNTADFTAGENEGMIQFDTDAISRSVVSGGALGGWVATTALPTAAGGVVSVAYNGYLYALGIGVTTTVLYAPINNDGSLGVWTATTSFTGVSRIAPAVAAYNGYLYVLGGSSNNGVQYAPINTDGTLGVWASTSSFTTGRGYADAIAYNGYLYLLAGSTSTNTVFNDVQFAPINANGTLGAWVATTSLPSGRDETSVAVYNGYIYVAAGYAPSGTLADVQFARINSDGTLGAWTATTSLGSASYGMGLSGMNGYLYSYGGSSQSTVNYALINADGTVGTWVATSNMLKARNAFGATAYNGRLYAVGGYNGGAQQADVDVASVAAMPASTLSMSAWATTTILGAGSGSATARAATRQQHSSVAYNGYLYLIGGQAGTTPTTTVHYAYISASGDLGAWTASTNPLPLARFGHKSVVVNGYIYVFGGTVSGAASNTILYSLIGANGLNGTWTSVTPSGISSQNQAVAEYNGYLYVLGGGTGTNTVHYSLIGANGAPGAWTATTVLPVTIYSHTSVAYNGYIYVMGGTTSSGSNSTTYYAPINANGAVGAWSTTTSISILSSKDDLHAYQGYLIFNSDSQLRDGSFTEFDGLIRYAKINADGTIGTWNNGTVYTSDRSTKGSALYNGYLYTTGGVVNSAAQGDTLFARLTVGVAGMGSVGTSNAWQSTTNVNNIVYGHRSVAYNGYLYINGGIAGSFSNATRYAPINSDGTLGAWTTAANTMSTPRYKHGLAVYNGYIYASGGQTSSGVWTNTVEYAQILADGTLGPWQLSANSLAGVREGHVSVAYNGRLYVIAGVAGASTVLGDVAYATINADGSLGTWTATTSTTPVNMSAGFEYGGYIYITGGANGVYVLDSVRYAKINADGTLGAWRTSETRFIPGSSPGRISHAAVAYNGFMYISGGERVAGTALGDMQYAPIYGDGSIGEWKTTNTISTASGGPTAYTNHSMAAYKGKLYIVGGRDATPTTLATSYVTSVNAPSLTGVYSKIVNLGQESTLNSITMNGISPPGQNILMFKTAGADGIYGAWKSSNSLAGAPISNVKYIMLRASLDDSGSSSIFSSLGRTSLSDITVDYTPTVVTGLTPDNRLRQNKYFDSSGVLQPLQTQ